MIAQRLTFTARSAPEIRRQLTLAAGFILAVSVIVGVGLPTATRETVSVSTFVWLPAVVHVWIVILRGDDEREVAITDEGLRVRQVFHD